VSDYTHFISVALSEKKKCCLFRIACLLMRFPNYSKTGAFALPILQDLKLCDDKQQTHGKLVTHANYN